MRMTQFWEFVSHEFGESYGRVVVDDLILDVLGGVTGREALDSGVEPREVWYALCEALDVPRNRWHGRDKPSAAAAKRSRANSVAGQEGVAWPAQWPR